MTYLTRCCIHCGSREHGTLNCDADTMTTLMFRLKGLAMDWSNTSYASKDPTIVARQNALRQCGDQLTMFLQEYTSVVAKTTIAEAYIDSRGSSNTSSIRQLFPSLSIHETDG